MSNVTLDSILDVSHLSIQPEDDEYTVGDPATQNFIRIPYEGVAALRLLDGSRTLGTAQAQLLENEQIEVDMLDFGETLLELDLVRSLDGQVLRESAPDAAAVSKLGWMKPVGNVLFSKLAVALYVLIGIATLALLGMRPELLPTSQDFFVFSSIGVSMLVMFVATWLLIIFHEAAHLFAAAAAGAPVQFRLSIRWFWVVIEADMTGLWSQPRRSRYLPFLAGICCDACMLFLSLLLQLWLPDGELLSRVFQMTAALALFQLGSQLLVFVRTDVYFVLITAMNAADLSGDAKRFLKRWLLRTKKSVEAWELLQPKERSRGAWFGLFYVIGVIAACLLYGLMIIPATFTAVSGAWTEIVSDSSSTWLLLDGLLVLAVTLLQFGLWVAGALSRYRHNRMQKAVGS